MMELCQEKTSLMESLRPVSFLYPFHFQMFLFSYVYILFLNEVIEL